MAIETFKEHLFHEMVPKNVESSVLTNQRVYSCI